MGLTNTLTESTNTTPSQILSGSTEIVRTFKKGKGSIGLRAHYLTTSVDTGVVQMQYTQIPVFGTLGFTQGSKKLQMRLSLGGGYQFKSRMTFAGSGSTDGPYAAHSPLALANAQLVYFLGGKSRIGIVAEAGYIYALSKVLLNVPYTSPDLDGDSSGFFTQAGLIFRF